MVPSRVPLVNGACIILIYTVLFLVIRLAVLFHGATKVPSMFGTTRGSFYV
jgi:hypothetical protein